MPYILFFYNQLKNANKHHEERDKSNSGEDINCLVFWPLQSLGPMLCTFVRMFSAPENREVRIFQLGEGNSKCFLVHY